jgi:hypothetical protein
MTEAILKTFINSKHYDIRVSRNGRWIDQKCVYDVVSFVADCIKNYCDDNGTDIFCSPDIWRSNYTKKWLLAFFTKADPNIEESHDEFNKFFRQPCKMLAAAGVLTELGGGVGSSPIVFKIVNRDVLDFLAMRPQNALIFLQFYVEKTIIDSGLSDPFETFFEYQDEDSFGTLKERFKQFCFDYTPINNKREADRIFSKVLNILAFGKRKHGTAQGRLSNENITLSDITYNRENFRDVRKSRTLARREAPSAGSSITTIDYEIARAKRVLNDFNINYNGGLSEIMDAFATGEATHIHHIFPKHEFPSIAAYLENLIALTPGQHFSEAHPTGNTSKIEPAFQYLCLLAKLRAIRLNLDPNGVETVIYSFRCFLEVLNTGYSTTRFSEIPENDFITLTNTLSLFVPASRAV